MFIRRIRRETVIDAPKKSVMIWSGADDARDDASIAARLRGLADEAERKDQDNREPDAVPEEYKEAVQLIREAAEGLPESFEAPGNRIVWLRITQQGGAEDMDAVQEACRKLREDARAGRIAAVCTLGRYGISGALFSMVTEECGGWKIEHDLSPDDLFAPGYGSVICEVKEGEVGRLASTYRVIGEVLAAPDRTYGHIRVPEAGPAEEPAQPAPRKHWGWGKKAVNRTRRKRSYFRPYRIN